MRDDPAGVVARDGCGYAAENKTSEFGFLPVTPVRRGERSTIYLVVRAQLLWMWLRERRRDELGDERLDKQGIYTLPYGDNGPMGTMVTKIEIFGTCR